MTTYGNTKNKIYRKIAEVMGYYVSTIYRGLKDTVDLKEFYSVITSDDLVNKRDYFYSCLVKEEVADKWWDVLMDRLDKQWEKDNEEDFYISTEDIKRTLTEAFS